MSVVSTKELARTYEQEVTRPMIAKRRFVCVLSDDTTTGGSASFNDIVIACLGSTAWGQTHPDLTSWKLRKGWVNEGYEGSPYHVEAVFEYGIVRDEEILHPTSRPSVWTVEGGQGEVPALYYYAGSGNSTTYPLTNSAYDFYPGLTVEEATARITIRKNFPDFPTSWMAAMNAVNSDLYFGMPVHTGKVAKVDASYAYEEFGGTIIKYWDTTATIAYRQSGHKLQLPDVGYNFIDGGEKRRAMVFDFQNSEWVPSPNPIGLNGYGAPSPTGNPAILPLRVNPETSFATLFGTPPT
jgi:hypothetical protein